MHRSVDITVPPSATDALVAALDAEDGVIGLSVSRGASVKPPGDLVTAHVLNEAMDRVLRHVDAAGAHGPVSTATSELATLIAPEQNDRVVRDTDEAVWEEMESAMRHQGRITPNYVALMALGGGAAAAGLVEEPAGQVIAFLASALIAPGYEPIAALPFGLVHRKWDVMRRALWAGVVGYAALVAGAALAFAVLVALGDASAVKLAENPAAETLSHPTPLDLSYSLVGGIAGMIMLAAYRRSVIGGPLMLLAIIPAAALAGAALAVGDWELALEGAERVGIDVLFICAGGVLVVGLKQAFVHRRKPLV